VPFKIGEKTGDPVQMYLSDICRCLSTSARCPGHLCSCRFSAGLPIGMQIIGDLFQEPTLYRIAYAYQQATHWHHQKPLL